MAVVKPFRAVRYDEEVAGPLDALVAPTSSTTRSGTS
jgi:hypothetical protein